MSATWGGNALASPSGLAPLHLTSRCRALTQFVLITAGAFLAFVVALLLFRAGENHTCARLAATNPAAYETACTSTPSEGTP